MHAMLGSPWLAHLQAQLHPARVCWPRRIAGRLGPDLWGLSIAREGRGGQAVRSKGWWAIQHVLDAGVTKVDAGRFARPTATCSPAARAAWPDPPPAAPSPLQRTMGAPSGSRVAFLAYFHLGCATLFPWSALITAADFWESQFPVRRSTALPP